MTAQLTIVDAHQHFWDPERNYHPWLADKLVAFRYGDYSAIIRRYLPDDYLRDAHNYRVAGTVYIETEWDPRDPVGEMGYVKELSGSRDIRPSPWRRPGSTATTRFRCWNNSRPSTSCAASGRSRAPTPLRRTAAPAA